MWQSLASAPTGRPFLACVPPGTIHVVYRVGEHYVLQDDDITIVEPTLWMDVELPKC
jgi:hypothetical protein